MNEQETKITHIAAIMDGNRRYAKANNQKPWKGHESGADTLENFLEWCKELGIKEITLYTLSTENLNRSQEVLDYLFGLFRKFFKKFKKNKKVHEDKVKIKFIGNLSLVPKDIREQALEIQDSTKDYNNYIINFCFAYGGRQELVQAFNKIKKEKPNPEQEITEQDITNKLWLSSEPELIIRTGGNTRTSNFLPWQSAYSEWYFTDKLWPEITKQDLERAIAHFNQTKRNFGK